MLLVGVGEDEFALPIGKVERLCEISAEAIEKSGRESFVLIDDEPVPLLDLAECLGVQRGERTTPERSAPLALVEIRGERMALRVERFSAQQEIYVKPVPPLFAGVRGLAGLTVLGNGCPVFLLDLNQLPGGPSA